MDGIRVWCAHDRIVPLEELVPNARNPNKHPAEQLQLYLKIIKAHGWRRAIVVSKQTGLIVRGHGAYMAMQLGKLTAAPVNFQDYETPEAELEDLVADNELARLARCNKGELDKILKELRDVELAGILRKLDEPETSPTYPITSKLNESYDFVLIFTENASDFVFLQNLAGVQTESSYKKTGVGTGRCVPFQRFIKSLRENHHSLNVQGGDHDHTQAGPQLPGVRPGVATAAIPAGDSGDRDPSGLGQRPDAET